MERNKQIQDVIIIGGGPAGSTAATYLARMGYQVTLLEKDKFPRDHVGESLLPFCYELFEELDVLEDMKKRFARKPGVRFVGRDGGAQGTWCFGRVIKSPSALSFHVFRADFDDMLLRNSAKNGAAVLEEMKVRKVTFDTPDANVAVEATDSNGDTHTFNGRYLIDASGRDTFLARQNKWKRSIEDLDRVAFSTHWVDVELDDSLKDGLLQIVYLGTEKKGWGWVNPIRHDRLSIGIVLNNDYVKAQRKLLTENGESDWKAALYKKELFASEYLQSLLAKAKTAMPIIVNGNYSYYSEKKYGDNFVMIGDAASFLDPIFASGVYLAMNSARLIAKSVDHMFRGYEGEDKLTIEGAYNTINGAYGLMDKFIRLFYDPETIDFAQLGHAFQTFDSKLEFAYALSYYLVAGDFFHNHDEYHQLLDKLRDPQVVAAYKRIYMDNPVFEEEVITCGVDRNEIFAASLSEETTT